VKPRFYVATVRGWREPPMGGGHTSSLHSVPGAAYVYDRRRDHAVVAEFASEDEARNVGNEAAFQRALAKAQARCAALNGATRGE